MGYDVNLDVHLNYVGLRVTWALLLSHHQVPYGFGVVRRKLANTNYGFSSLVWLKYSSPPHHKPPHPQQEIPPRPPQNGTIFELCTLGEGKAHFGTLGQVSIHPCFAMRPGEAIHVPPESRSSRRLVQKAVVRGFTVVSLDL